MEEFYNHLENETNEQFNIHVNNFIESIKNDGSYAGDFEISAASISLNVEIINNHNFPHDA